ncbi:MAG TPA: chemotaxis protein CheD [Anaerolineae bacterium]|nr:chemotaxis protein CheD [Anaerolineae bacterium]
MDEIVVGIGEVRVATAPATLIVRGLGSCVAVILYDPTARVAGLAHVVLPEEPKMPADGRTRSAPGAIEGLLAEMLRHGARRVALMAHVVGGAQVLRTAGGTAVGQRNVVAVHTVLRQEGIPIHTEDTGGHRARSLTFDVSSGELTVYRLPIFPDAPRTTEHTSWLIDR